MARKAAGRGTVHAPTAMGSWVHAIIRMIDASGFDGRELAIQSGIGLRVLNNPEHRVPEAAVSRLWRAAVEATGNPAIGLRLHEYVTPATFGPLAYAALASADLRALFSRMQRYQRFLSDAVEMGFGRVGDVYEWSVERRSSDGPPDEGIDAFFALMVHTVRGLSAPRRVDPVRVMLRRPSPERVPLYSRLFGAPITFDAECDVLAYDWRDVERRLPDGNATLAEENDRIVANLLDQLGPGSTARRVRKALLDSLPEGPTEEVIARKLGTSKSSLHVALSREGTTYRDILNSTREDLARGYLESDRYTIKEIAFLLGFSDATAFSRACKRWTGQTPKELRERGR